jgi:hypothetical protein
MFIRVFILVFAAVVVLLRSFWMFIRVASLVFAAVVMLIRSFRKFIRVFILVFAMQARVRCSRGSLSARSDHPHPLAASLSEMPAKGWRGIIPT